MLASPCVHLLRLNMQLQKLLLLELYQENHLGLDELACDLGLILSETSLAQAYKEAFLMDLGAFLESTLLDVTLVDLHAELDQILRLIDQRRQMLLPEGRVLNIFLTLPDTLTVFHLPEPAHALDHLRP